MRYIKLLLFNPITRHGLKRITSYGLTGRIGGMLTDMMYTVLIFMPLQLVYMVFMMIRLAITNAWVDNKSNDYVDLVLLPVMFFIIINKDFFKSQSIAKRIYGYMVVDNGTGEPASSLKCALRNITCFLWPLEGIITLINKQRRLGDRIAGTRVIKIDPQPAESILADMTDEDSYNEWQKTVGISALMVVVLLGVSLLIVYLPL